MASKTVDKDIVECTFQPEIVSFSHLQNFKPESISKVPDIANQKSIDKFLERMALVKMNKESKIEALEKQPGSGKLWKNEITVP